MPAVARLCTILALVCAAALAGCGTSDEDQLRAVVKQLRAALDARDGARACGLLTAEAKAQLRGDCARAILAFDAGSPAVDGALTVQKDRASLATRSAGRTRAIAFVKSGGDWRVAELPLPTSVAG